MSKIISAIDIGSNGIRMLIAEHFYETSKLREIKKIRSPIRLGKEVFLDQPISAKTMDDAVETFLHFRNINHKYKVERCRAVATSALREAKNKNEFIEKIEKKTGIKIELIDGYKEGQLIFLAVNKELDLQHKKCILIDVGGGSVEVTFCENTKMIQTKSFPMGTVRILDLLLKRNLTEDHLNVIIGDHISHVSEFIDKHHSGHDLDFGIGTGGNLECMARLKLELLKKTPNSYLSLSELELISERLKHISLKDRVEKLHLRSDRADVILPATIIVKTILRQAGVNKILVPCVGLRNGILWSMVM